MKCKSLLGLNLPSMQGYYKRPKLPFLQVMELVQSFYFKKKQVPCLFLGKVNKFGDPCCRLVYSYFKKQKSKFEISNMKDHATSGSNVRLT